MTICCLSTFDDDKKVNSLAGFSLQLPSQFFPLPRGKRSLMRDSWNFHTIVLFESFSMDCHELTAKRSSSPLPEQMCYVRITSFHSHQRTVRVANPVQSFHLRRLPRDHKKMKLPKLILKTTLLKLYIYVLLPLLNQVFEKIQLITRMCTSNIKRTCKLNW